MTSPPLLTGGECQVCHREVALHPTAYPLRMLPHPSAETNALCAGTDLEWRDPIL